MSITELINMSIENKNAERPYEYRFVWKWLSPLLVLPREGRAKVKILDVGGAESKIAKTLADLGFDVTVIDLNPGDYGRARWIKENILTFDFPENHFEVILAISTVEHVGLPCYGQDVIDEYGDVKTMRKVYRWLKPYGMAIVTLPYGRPHHPKTFERVYNEVRLRNRILVDRWEVLEKVYMCNKGRWVQDSWINCLNYDGVVMLALRKLP